MAKKPARVSLSDQVRRHVGECGVSRYRIAKSTGISAAVLSRFVAGTNGMTLETLDRLAEFLNLEVVMHGPKAVAVEPTKGK